MQKMTRFGVSLPSDLIKAFDEIIQKKGYQNRSEAIRDLMRDYLVSSRWEESSSSVIGTVTIVYGHDTRELSNTLNTLQHLYFDYIVCATHVHMDEHNCLETVVLRGSSDVVRKIADQIISTKGVKHGKLVYTTTGEHLK